MGKAAKKLTLKQLMKRADRGKHIKSPFTEILSDLKAGFQRDYTIDQCCRNAGISRDTYWRWYKISDEFAEVMERSRDWLFKEARRVIADAIYDTKSTKDARWLLSRRERGLYALRLESTGVDGGSIGVNITNYDKKKLEKMGDDELKRMAADQARK